MIYLNLEDAIRNLKTPASLLIRHAERPHTPFRIVDYLTKITVRGRISAEEFGETIGEKLNGVSSSPVPRCLDTSETIIKGSGNITLPINVN